MAVAGRSLRRQAASVRGGVRLQHLQHLDDAPEGESSQGKRAYGRVPRNRGKNTTLIAAITLQGGMGESMTIEGATDAEAFEAYVEQFLAASLSEGRVVVLDKLGAHRADRVRELIEGRGAYLVFSCPPTGRTCWTP